MKHRLLYFSSALLLTIQSVSAQSLEESDSVMVTPIEPPKVEEVEPAASYDYALEEDTEEVKDKVKKDTINYPFISAAEIYIDYPKLFSFFTEFENKAEVGFRMQFFKHLIAQVELGRGRIRPQNFYRNADYEVSGNYYRVGLGYTKAMGAKSRLNFGFNYGSSFFNDKGTIQIESPSGLFDDLEEEVEREGLTGDWFEVSFGTESHMGKNIYLGFVARLRILNDYDSFEEFDVLSIPGYGRTFDKTIPAINLYIKYRIQFY